MKRGRSLLRRLWAAIEGFESPTERLGAPAEGGKGSPWQRFRRNFLFNLGIGCAVALGLRIVDDWGWLATRQDQAMDWMVRMNSGVSPDIYRGLPFVFIDLDEPTYREWGEPFHVPRDKLARLLRFAIDGGARLVLVDIDLSREAGEQDAELVALLRHIAEDGPEAPRVHIVLARTFREPWPPGASPWREERASFLDPLVARAPTLHWASTLFIRDRDLVIRRFRNFEPTCNGERPGVVPSIQLVATALLLDGPHGLQRLMDATLPHRPPCAAPGGDAPPPPEDRTLRLGDVEIDLAGDRVSSRILFDFGAPDSLERGVVPQVGFEGREVPLLTRLSARRVTEASQPVAASVVQGRVALIGASFADSRDVHRTPLGEMPGALILANAIYSLLQHGGLQPPGAGVVLAAQFLVIALVSAIFAPLRFYWAALVGTPLVLTVLLPLSFALFRHGIWLDFVLPVVAVQAVAIAKEYRERYSRMRDRLNKLHANASED